MKKYFSRSSGFLFSLLAILLTVSISLWTSCGEKYNTLSGPDNIVLSALNPEVRAVIEIQDRYTNELLAKQGIVGAGTGITADGRPAIIIFAKNSVLAKQAALPTSIEDVPVLVKVTGEIRALKGPPPGGGGQIKPTKRFDRPVPIGVSTGNEEECSAGTIGCRVKKGNKVFALSNNHVYALENDASPNSEILQPGRFDTKCDIDPNDVMGQLFDFEPIVFSTQASNTIDAAIALSSTSDLDTSTPSDGYGTPKSNTVAAGVGMDVQKYGRTTSLTNGTILAINTTVDVAYFNGTARFVNQICVESQKPFIKAGDSGSLMVTDPGRNPVGLLYAADASGKFSVANPIDLVLNKFKVTIDGE